MTILEDLYYGNIIPYEHDFRDKNRFNCLMEQIIQNEKAILSALTEEQQKSFDTFKDDVSKLDSIVELDAFTKGFGLATRLMIEVLVPESNAVQQA